ncbi:helix-turn-helix transcriptional regulator [Streptosporangium sp. NPDC051022]|uniref:helix-turn-helix transcriptional regulator n=1 Tax=Streptosporangium sp. NPDC051022 TaxID=3155752 RepID=UPI00343A0C83
MSYLRRGDYERMLGLAVGVLEARDTDRVWCLIAHELMRSLDGAVLVMKDVEWTPGRGVVEAWHRDTLRASVLEGLGAEHIRRGYPFAGYYGFRTDRSPLTAAQLVGERMWLHSATASATRESFGTRHMLGVPLPDIDGHVRGFVVHRAGEDFGERDRLYAERIQPLLAGAAAQHGLLARWQSLVERPGPREATDRPGPREAAGRAERYGLTPREITVLLMLSEGFSAVGMARRLGISVRTVHKHLQNLYRKLDTVDRLGTVLRAQEVGLLPAAPERQCC